MSNGTRARVAAIPAFVALVLAVVTFVSRAQAPQEAANSRSDASLVRVDVYAVTDDGQPVTDLTEADFEVREDNAVQSVATFERVAIPGADSGPSSPQPPAADATRAIGAADRARILVVFLDTYYTDPTAAQAVLRPLARLLDETLTATDVLAVVTPEMSARDVVFSRRGASARAVLERFEQFSTRDGTRRDPEEERYEACFPERGGEQQCVDPATGQTVSVPTSFAGIAREMVGRRREQRVVKALTDLTRTLGGLNDGRKAVLVVSSGWLLYKESPELMRLGRCDSTGTERRPGAGPADTTAREGRTPDGVDRTICEADRRRLGMLDLQPEFRRMMDGANRANVSFYPLDPHRLAAPDRPGAGPEGTAGAARAGSRADSLALLADNTDGLRIVNTDDLSGGLGRLASDLTSYYLIGYYPTNTRPDGGSRRISVSVNRRGVTVRARRGYRAVSAGELERQRTAAALAGQTLGGTLSAVQSALAGLLQLKPSLPVRSRIAYGPTANGRIKVWAVTEINARTAREGAWLGGGAVDVSLRLPDNSAVASAEASLPAGHRAVVLDLGEIAAPDVTTALHVRLRPAGEGPSIADEVALAPLAGALGPGVPILSKRGPTTGARYVPTADPQFTRTERVRVELLRVSAPASFTATLLDRAGAALNVRVATSVRPDGPLTWAVAELALAPLAHGDYVVKLVVDGHESVTAIRVVP